MGILIRNKFDFYKKEMILLGGVTLGVSISIITIYIIKNIWK